MCCMLQAEVAYPFTNHNSFTSPIQNDSSTSNYSYLPPPNRKSPKLAHKSFYAALPSGVQVDENGLMPTASAASSTPITTVGTEQHEQTEGSADSDIYRVSSSTAIRSEYLLTTDV